MPVTNLRASDLAARRIREVRQRYGWTVKELADRCSRRGAPQITATVITNLETRRHATRQITVEEVFVLAEVLAVPPVQLMAPLDAAEDLEVTPDVHMDASTAVAWIAGDPLGDPFLWDAHFPAPGITEQLLRRGSNPVITLRQMRIVADSIIRWDDAAQDPELPENDPRKIEVYAKDIEVMADRLMHLAARMEAWGYDLPEMGVRSILERRGLPATLREWREKAAPPAPRRHNVDRPGRFDDQG